MYRYIITCITALFFVAAGRCQPGQLADTAVSPQFIKGMMLTNEQVALYRQCRNDERHALDSIATANITDRNIRANVMRTVVARYRNLFYTSLNEEQKQRYELLEKAKKEQFLRELQQRKEALQSAQSPQQ